MALFGPPNIEKMKAKRDVNGLSKVLKNPDILHTRICIAAADALAEIGSPEAVQALALVLNDRSCSEELRGSIVRSLGKIGGPTVVGPLIACLGSVHQSGREAEEALVKIGSPAAKPLLYAMIYGGAWAPHVFRRIGDYQTVEPEIDELISYLNYKKNNPLTPDMAARILGKIGAPRAIESLIQHMAGAGLGTSLSETVGDALVEIGAPAVEPLIAELNNGSYVRRGIAASLLGKIGDPRAVEPLIAALSDSDIGVRRWAAEALGKIGDPRAVEPLIPLLKPGNYIETTIIALGEIGDRRAVMPLIEYLNNSPINDWKENEAAARALGKIGDPRAVKPLTALFNKYTDGRGGRETPVNYAAQDALNAIKVRGS
jgi:HEAT repeat protein